MPVTKINVFGGMVPAINERLLPDNNAALSRDTWLYNGPLSGFKAPVFIRNLTNATAKRVYRIPLDPYEKTNFNNSTWMEFTDPTVDVVRGPINDDAFSRYYWTGEDTDPYYNSLARIQAGSPPLRLGVPQPTAAPTVNAPVTAPDTVAPVALSATANNSQIVISFTEARLLDYLSIPPASAFKVTSGGVNYQVSGVYVSGAGLTVTLELSNPIKPGAEVSIAYTPPGDDGAIQDNSKNKCIAFTLSITGTSNSTLDTAGPVYGWSDATAITIWVSFVDDSDMDETQIPATTAWAVSVNGLPRAVTDVYVMAGKKAYGLTLATSLAPADVVRLSYIKPSTGYVRDIHGNAAPSFGGQIVRNNTTVADIPAGPIPTSAETTNTNQIRITFDKDIADTTGWTIANVSARFTIKVNGTSVGINWAGRPNTKAITLQSLQDFVYGDVITVSYAVPGTSPYLKDTKDHNAIAFTDFRVVNNVTFVDTYNGPE
jgi:uncharacterized repeat protein (TIGR02059 family)